eukprot:6088642-Amphidinium_carterae.1
MRSSPAQWCGWGERERENAIDAFAKLSRFCRLWAMAHSLLDVSTGELPESTSIARLGFAQTSSPEEWLDRGRSMFDNESFADAEKCFKQAEKGLPYARFWCQLALARQSEANTRRVGDGDPFVKASMAAAEAFKKLVQMVMDAAAQERKSLPSGLFGAEALHLEAAKHFVGAGSLKPAAVQYEAAGYCGEAAECMERVKPTVNWSEVAIPGRDARIYTLEH